MSNTKKQTAVTPLAPTLRPYKPEDEALVMDSWCKALRPPRPTQVRPFTSMRREEFGAHRALLDLLLTRYPPIIAHAPGFPDQIYGWMCGGRVGPIRAVHGLYVRQTWRRMGVASTLVAQLGDGVGFVTHETALRARNPKLWAHLLKLWELTWNPYIVAFS